MNGLNQIVRSNNKAVSAYVRNEGGKHLLTAPIKDNFNYNIPWEFKDGVLHAWINKETNGNDLIKLKRLVAGQEGVGFKVEIHEYQ